MTLPIARLTELVQQHASTRKDDPLHGGHDITVNEVIWHASGSVKATAATPQDALAQAQFLVDGLIETAGRPASAATTLGAVSERDVDEPVWRGTFSVVFPLAG